MTASQVLGVAIVAACFLLPIGMTVHATGWRIAAGIWAFSVGLTAVIVLGTHLAVGGAA